MRDPLLTFLPILFLAYLATCLVTLETMRNVTALAVDMRGRIERSSGRSVGEIESGLRGSGEYGTGQHWTGDGNEKRAEVEDTITAGLKLLCSDLLVELEKPLAFNDPLSYDSPHSTPLSSNCSIVTSSFHRYLSAIVHLLRAIQELQIQYHFTSDSGVFSGVAWMQHLWASRRGNSQNRSFIEQQLKCYKPFGCEGLGDVLRRNVELVEYMNDLMDEF